MTRHDNKTKPIIGWREWVQLPELCASPVKVKIDTGARTSALHAFDLQVEEIDGASMATFELHPHQRSAADAKVVSHVVHSFRRVRSSDGKSELRPTIVTDVALAAERWPIEITLTSRDEMGFRMLLGRAALRPLFVVDPGRSYLGQPRRPNRSGAPHEIGCPFTGSQRLQHPAS